MTMEPQIQYCTSADGTNIACCVLGTGEPPVVIVSHWLLLIEIMQAERGSTIDAIAGYRRAVHYDRRGTGYSAREVTDVSLHAQLADLEAVANRNDMPRFALVGYGDGAFIASVYAARNPDRVVQLAIVSPAIIGGDVPASVATLIRSNWGLGRRALADLTFGDRDAPSRARFREQIRRAMSPAVAAAYLDEQAAWRVTPELHNVTAPTLVVHVPGGSAEAARELAAAIPGSSFVTAERAFDHLVRAFLRGESANPQRGRRLPEKAAGSVITVLFTDIVGHTEMMQRLGDAKGRDVLREHERITRETLKQHGGAEVKTDGDSFMASFASVSSAVDCAVALQRSFAEYSASADEPIVVRMGLHAGEPIAEGNDLFGSSVIMASRIKAQASGGEILVSDVVRSLLSGKAFTFTDRGEFAMKGFDDAVRLYEVRWHE